MSKKPKPIVLMDPLEIVFVRWVKALPRESLPDLARTLRAIAERRPAEKAHAAALKFLRAAGYPDASHRAAVLVRSCLRVVSER